MESSSKSATSRKGSKRQYRRRSENERILELEERIQALRAKVEAKKRKDSPVLVELPKVGRKLQKFAQLAVDHGRHDIANSTMAFAASLDRIYHSEVVVAAADAPEDDESEE